MARMRVRRPIAAMLALLALAVTACGAAAGTSSGSSTAANGPASGAPASTSAAAPSPRAQAAAPGLRRFTFPAGVDIEFKATLPPSGPRRDAVIGYENYIGSLWYAVSTHGAGTAYEQYISGNALTFARVIIRQFKQYNLHLAGKVVYFGISVPSVFRNAAAVVRACVNASGLDRVKRSGQSIGPVFNYTRYQEQVAVGEQKGSPAWLVSHTENVPAASGGSAGMCA